MRHVSISQKSFKEFCTYSKGPHPGCKMKKLIFKCQELVEGVDTRARNLLEKINPKQIKKVKTRTTNMNYGYKAKNIKKKHGVGG